MTNDATPGRDPYRRSARYYDRFLEPLNAGVRDVVLRIDPPQKGWSVLDVGCGTGTMLERYAGAGCAVSGVDVSPAMLDRARARLSPGADLHLIDGAVLPFDDGTFDRVLTSMVIHEVADHDRDAFLAEMVRVTNDGGSIVITEFRFGPLRGAKARIIKPLVWLIERFAGHYSGYRSFRASGGMPALAARNHLDIDREKIVAGGNIAIYTLGESV
jgi:ubiquinone/menaquinone biosynthesis C-methylase UbiE